MNYSFTILVYFLSAGKGIFFGFIVCHNFSEPSNKMTKKNSKI